MLGGLAEPVGDSALPGDRQTDQIIESLNQIHRALLALVLLGDLHRIGEGIGERLHVQQTAAALQIHHVVDHVILAQQRLELSAVVGKLDVGKRIFIALQTHILDDLGDAGISVLRFAILPIGTVNHLLHTRFCDRIQVFAHFHKNVLPFSFIISVKINDCVSSCSRPGEIIKEYGFGRVSHSLKACHNSVYTFRKREIVLSESKDIIQKLCSVCARIHLRTVPKSFPMLGLSVLKIMDLDFASYFFGPNRSFCNIVHNTFSTIIPSPLNSFIINRPYNFDFRRSVLRNWVGGSKRFGYPNYFQRVLVYFYSIKHSRI